MQVDNHWERMTYNRIYPRKPYREKVYQWTAQAQHSHKRPDERRGKRWPSNKQSSRYNIQARFWSTSANHRNKKLPRSLEYPPRTFSKYQSDEHLTDYLRSHKPKTVQLQACAQTYKQPPSRFRQSCWLPDRYLFLRSPKHQNVLQSHYSDEYRNRLLYFSISNLKRLEGQDHKLGRSGVPNHQAFQIHEEKQEGSKRHINLCLLDSPRTQKLLYRLRVSQKRANNPLHRLLLDKAFRTASPVCLLPNSLLWLPKKSLKRLYNTTNCSQGRAKRQKRQLTTKGT